MNEKKMKGLERFNLSTYYHIVNYAVGKENLFRNDDNYLFFFENMPCICLRFAIK